MDLPEDFELRSYTPDEELIRLWMRHANLKSKLIKLQAELDNVIELLKQKGQM